MGTVISRSLLSALIGIISGFLLSLYMQPVSRAAGTRFSLPKATVTPPKPSVPKGLAPTKSIQNSATKFSEAGTMVLSQPKSGKPYWTLVYLKGGRPTTAKLVFSADSFCDTGQGGSQCSPERFINGMKAKVTGIRQADSVDVLLLAITA